VSDPIILAVRMACDKHDRGEIDDDTLMQVFKVAINATAKLNGYEQRFGKPFPEVKP